MMLLFVYHSTHIFLNSSFLDIRVLSSKNWRISWIPFDKPLYCLVCSKWINKGNLCIIIQEFIPLLRHGS